MTETIVPQTNNTILHLKQMAIEYKYFKEHLNYYLKEFVETRDIKEKTMKDYLDSVMCFNDWLTINIDNPVCHPITPKTFKLWKEYLIINYKPRTINLYLTGARQFCKFLEEYGFPNLMINIKNVKIGQDFSKIPLTIDQFITIDKAMFNKKEELKNLYNSGKIKKDKYLLICRDYAIFNLAVRNMLREIEMNRANKTDIQTRQKQIILKVQGKGSDDKSDFVVITEDTYKIIDEYLKVRGKDSFEALFISISSNCYGTRLSTRSFSKILKEIFKVYGGIDTPLITGHSTRHTGATFLHEANVDLLEISEAVRHKNINTTKIYARINNRLSNPVENKLQDYIRKERMRTEI